jgi:type IV pilus assembly protein PilC
VTVAEPNSDWKKEVRVPRHLVVFFTRQLAVMLDNGISLVPAIDCLSLQKESPDFTLVLKALGQELDEGSSLSVAASSFPGVFPELWVSMTKVGESTGGYSVALDKAATWMERDLALMHRVKNALTYPLLVIAVSVSLALLVFTFVLPRFVEIFETLGVKLPLLTRIVIALTNVAKNPGTWVFLVVALPALYYACKEAWANHPVTVYSAIVKIPILGSILHCSSMARFCSAARASLATGLDMLGAMHLAARASGSPLLLANSDDFRNSLVNGLSLSEHMSLHRHLYDEILINMVATGEEAASVENMLARVEPYYEDEVKHLVESLGAALEPILLLGTGSMVGLILLAVFLPLYSYLSVL